MREFNWNEVSPKAENMEMDYLRSLGIEPNFADVSRHVEKLFEPIFGLTDEDESELEDLRSDNEELSSNCEALEDKLDSIKDYVSRMRKQLKEMNFEGKGEIEAILSDIEGEL